MQDEFLDTLQCFQAKSAKSVSDANGELQQSNLLFTKAYARRTDIF